MADSPLIIKSKAFALDVIQICKELRVAKCESALINQFLRSGTSIGANIREAFGLSDADTTDRKVKGIGGRYSARSNGFYELFTDNHHIRFCRTTKTTPFKNFLMRIGWNAYSKYDSDFWSLEKRLRTIGYSTMDLT